jgi:hypothetical protein
MDFLTVSGNVLELSRVGVVELTGEPGREEAVLVSDDSPPAPPGPR